MLARARPGVAAAGAGEAGPCQGPLPAAPLAPAQQSQVSGDAVHSPPHPAPVHFSSECVEVEHDTSTGAGTRSTRVTCHGNLAQDPST